MAEAAALYNDADRLKEQGKLEESVAKLREALQVDPSYALAHSGLAVLMQKLGQHEEAIDHARKVCELEPNDPFSYTALSVTYQRAYAGTGNHAYIQLAEEAMARSHMIQGA